MLFFNKEQLLRNLRLRFDCDFEETPKILLILILLLLLSGCYPGPTAHSTLQTLAELNGVQRLNGSLP